MKLSEAVAATFGFDGAKNYEHDVGAAWAVIKALQPDHTVKLLAQPSGDFTVFFTTVDGSQVFTATDDSTATAICKAGLAARGYKEEQVNVQEEA
jgi:hypothetical protein